MGAKQYFKNRIFNIGTDKEFALLALELFQFQAQHNSVYNRYLQMLKINPLNIKCLKDIPFLPIQFFKNFEVRTETFTPKITFTSSATSGQGSSKHAVEDVSIYESAYLKGFHAFYGNPKAYCIVALLPSYLERTGSSLIYMCAGLIKLSADTDSGFYLNEFAALAKLLAQKRAQNKKVLLIGVSFGLLDFAEAYPMDLSHVTVMETGGMKGRRKELVRNELHQQLKQAFNVTNVHSEYGMTELLSQAYSVEQGIFATPCWMKIYIRQTDDPFTAAPFGKTGGINVIDLANLDSCAFIETMDMGRKVTATTFEVLGRFDHAEVRGCNLMIH